MRWPAAAKKRFFFRAFGGGKRPLFHLGSRQSPANPKKIGFTLKFW
jgi:hypothetical protein